jgi:hypothetical protein
LKLFGFLRKPETSRPADAAWWAAADAAAEAIIDEGTIARLASESAALTDDADDAERRDEMIDGLRALSALQAEPVLPVLETQHRAIGADVCHFSAPASTTDVDGAAGRLLLTSRRVLFVGRPAVTWPWHRVRRVERSDRVLDIIAAGGESAQLRFNSYADVLTAQHVARRLAR